MKNKWEESKNIKQKKNSKKLKEGGIENTIGEIKKELIEKHKKNIEQEIINKNIKNPVTYRYKNSLTINKCECCGELLRRNQKRFCSYDCSNKYKTGKKLKRKIPKNFIYWGNKISDRKCYICNNFLKNKQKKYCCEQCQYISYKNLKVNRISKNCLFCNKEFLIKESDIKLGRGLYCCRKCKDSDPNTIKRREEKCLLNNGKNTWEIALSKFSNTKPELKIKSLLDEMNLNYLQQYRIYYDETFYKMYDFYLIDYNTLIEVDGDYWHVRNRNINLNENQLNTIKNDEFKNELAFKNNFRLIRFWETDIMSDNTEIIIKELKNIIYEKDKNEKIKN